MVPAVDVAVTDAVVPGRPPVKAVPPTLELPLFGGVRAMTFIALIAEVALNGGFAPSSMNDALKYSVVCELVNAVNEQFRGSCRKGC